MMRASALLLALLLIALFTHLSGSFLVVQATDQKWSLAAVYSYTPAKEILNVKVLKVDGKYYVAIWSNETTDERKLYRAIILSQDLEVIFVKEYLVDLYLWAVDITDVDDDGVPEIYFCLEKQDHYRLRG